MGMTAPVGKECEGGVALTPLRSKLHPLIRVNVANSLAES